MWDSDSDGLTYATENVCSYKIVCTKQVINDGMPQKKHANLLFT
jgi:hypothetical protein